MGYYLYDHARSHPPDASDDLATRTDAQLEELLETGGAAQRPAALRELVRRQAEASLVHCLASTDPTVARLAIHGLWECWLNEMGSEPRAQIETGIESMNDGNLTAAAEIFGALIVEYPLWAEPVNKQATVLYLQGLPERSMTLCRKVVGMKPDHFGAWNGMALCAIQVEDWMLAQEAVRESLRLQPHSGTNLQLLKLVESRLPTL